MSKLIFYCSNNIHFFLFSFQHFILYVHIYIYIVFMEWALYIHIYIFVGSIILYYFILLLKKKSFIVKTILQYAGIRQSIDNTLPQITWWKESILIWVPRYRDISWYDFPEYHKIKTFTCTFDNLDNNTEKSRDECIVTYVDLND